MHLAGWTEGGIGAPEGKSVVLETTPSIAADAKRRDLLPQAEEASRAIICFLTQQDDWHLILNCYPPVLLQHITALERRVGRLAVEEMTYKEIAKALGLKLGTVKSYLGHIFGKFSVKSRVGLARYYGLLSCEHFHAAKEEGGSENVPDS